jgi:hypothetical protein
LIGTITENLVLSGTGGGNGALQANDGGTDVIYSGTVELASTSGIGGGSGFVISGAISGDGGLLKLSGNAVTLSGAGSNTYLGTTTLGGNGKLVLSKTGGAIAIPGDLALSSESFNGNNSGVVLAASEQIADTATREAELAAQTAGSIQHIFAVTEQTGEGTRSTVQQVRELARVADELRQSVSRFKIG